MAGESAQVYNTDVRVGKIYENLESFVITDQFVWHFDTIGQDAAETIYIKVWGQYVNLKKKAYDEINNKVVF